MLTQYLTIFQSVFDVDGSSYNTYFEIAALVFLTIFAVRFFTSLKFPSKVNKVFSVALVAAWLDIAFDIFGSYLIDTLLIAKNNAGEAILESDKLWIVISNSGFYLFQVIFPAILATYVIYLAGRSFKENKKLLLILVPAGLFFIVVATNPLTRLITFVDENQNGVMSYLHGPVFPMFYIMVFFYFILTAILTFHYKKSLNRGNVLTIVSLMAVLAVALVVQMIFPNLLLTGTGITAAIYLVLTRMSNPDDMIDKITGLYNYTAIDNFIASSNQDERNYFIVLKLLNTDDVNETFGVTNGNKLYESIGAFLLSISSHDAWAFRIFGGRFVLIFKDKIDQLKAVDLLYKRFNKAWEIENISIVLKSSIFYFSRDAKNYSESFIEFIASLDREPSDLSTGPVLIGRDAFDRIERRQKVVRVIKRVFNNNQGELTMNFQPIYDLKSKAFTHSEALIRLIDPELGYIPPDEFIPITETIGYADKVDEFALETTCKVLQNNLNIAEISVNISCAEFFDNPAEKFLGIVSKYKVDPSRISFEITETAAAKYPEKINEFMRIMVMAGFKFLLDDFGTGYSNIVTILDKPFSGIKLDKTFLKNDDVVDTVLDGVVSMFKKLNSPITIEGVETEQQLKRATDLGVDFIQGYYFSRPLPQPDFEAFIAKKEAK